MSDGELDLDAIKERCSAIASGPKPPWKYWYGPANASMRIVSAWDDSAQPPITVLMDKPDAPCRINDVNGHKKLEALLQFIAHARTDIPALIAEIEKLREAITVVGFAIMNEEASQ